MITVFLSHASEDKDDFVRPLAVALRSDFKVWFDEYELTLGDSLLKRIDEGLRSCDYGIVVLSQHFFAKQWPRAALDGLFALETTEKKVILPIWKGVSEDEVRNFSPILAGRLGVSTDRGVEKVVYEIKRAVDLLDRQKGLAEAAWKEKFASLNADVKHENAADALARTTDGVQRVTKVARDIIVEGRRRTEGLIKDFDALGLRFSRDPAKTGPDLLLVTGGPRRVSLLLSFKAPVSNSADHCSFTVAIYRDRDLLEDVEERRVIEQFKFSPNFDRQFKVYWQSTDTDKIFSAGDALLDFVFERFAEILSRELKGYDEDRQYEKR